MIVMDSHFHVVRDLIEEGCPSLMTHQSYIYIYPYLSDGICIIYYTFSLIIYISVYTHLSYSLIYIYNTNNNNIYNRMIIIIEYHI